MTHSASGSSNFAKVNIVIQLRPITTQFQASGGWTSHPRNQYLALYIVSDFSLPTVITCIHWKTAMGWVRQLSSMLRILGT